MTSQRGLQLNKDMSASGGCQAPTQEERDAWMSNPHSYTGGEWRYVVLPPGYTFFFTSGTIHFVFRIRDRQTLALGGHILQWSGIEQWLKVVVAQMKNPRITNEKMAQSAPKYVRVVSGLVTNRIKTGRVEEMGGRDAVGTFFALVKVGGLSHLRPLADDSQEFNSICYKTLVTSGAGTDSIVHFAN